MRNSSRSIAAFALLAGLGVGQAYADGIGDAVHGQVMLGINQNTGVLVKYDFDADQLTNLGTVQSQSLGTLTGVKAAVYFPGFQNIFALWTSAADHQNKLVYVNVADGSTTLVANDLEGGSFTGAAPFSSVNTPYAFYAMQAAKIKPPSTISGLININPNNSAANEFTVTEGNGSSFTRDNLADKNIVVDANGTYYQGDATYVHVKPKGNGNQNGLLIDGQAYALQNSNTYNFNGAMTVRVFNDKTSGNGKAMGKWWIQIISGNVYINDAVVVLTPNRLVQVDQDTGVVTEVVRLDKTYSGLATHDGNTFYTVSNGDLYKIDAGLQSVTDIGPLALNQPAGMAFVGTHLVVYNQATSTASEIDPATGHTIAPVPGFTAGALFPIMPAPQSQVLTANRSATYD